MFQEVSDEIKNEIVNDPGLVNLKIDNYDKFNTVMRYLKLKKDISNGYYPKIKIDGPYWEVILYPTKEQQLKERRMKLISLRGEDSRDYKAQLEDFNLTTVKRKKIINHANDIISKMVSNKNSTEKKKVFGMYIHSEGFQIGKTFLANAIVNKLADNEIDGIFIFTPSLTSQAREFKNLEAMMKELKETTVLVLDDLGAEYKSEWFRLEVLMPVLQSRLANNKLTLITSNFNLEQLKTLYMKTSMGVDVERLLSRIMELCFPFEMDE